MENVAELGNLLWRAMNFTICPIQPVSGMFQQELIQDRGTKDKNQFPKSRFIARIIKIKRRVQTGLILCIASQKRIRLKISCSGFSIVKNTI